MTKEQKDKLKNELFEAKGITFDSFEKDENPFVGMFFEELCKVIDKALYQL